MVTPSLPLYDVDVVLSVWSLVVDLLALGLDDDVAALVLAEVDLGLRRPWAPRRRSSTGMSRSMKVGLAVATSWRWPAPDRAVAVGVGEVRGLPGRLRHAAGVEVAGRQQHLRVGLAVGEVVAVDVDVVDLVEAPDPLQLLVVVCIDRAGPTAGCCCTVSALSARAAALSLPSYANGLTSHASRGSYAVCVASMLCSMYGRSFDDSAGCTRNRWTNAGYDRAGHDGHERPQPDGEHRQHPAPPPDVDDEQHRRRTARSAAAGRSPAAAR